MSGKNETPRQKMIGMMYLILTALLALNVSKDVLDSFIVVNKGLENTNKNFTAHNDELYAQFNLAKSVDPVRVTPNWKKAQDVKLQAANLISYIDDIQNKLVAETDGVSKQVADTLQMANINSKDNYDIPTNIMIGNTEDGSDGISHQLKNKLVDYKKILGHYILPVDRKKIEIGIDTENPPDNQNNENWEVYNFFHRPLVASITILSKLKNDVKNAESTVVDYLLKQVDEGNLKFDTIAAKVVPQSNYVLLGEEYKADLFLAAFNKTRNPEIQVGGSKINVNRGLGKYNVRTSKEGIVSYSGMVKVVAPSGKEMSFPFKSEYIVARPALTVSADNMNVFYAGLDNPVSVSVPGIPNERLSVSIDNGKISPLGNGKFSVTVPNGIQAANIAVTATMENGEKRNMGVSKFRVKRIPDPKTRYAKLIADGSLTKEEIIANPGVIAYYQSFEFNANPRVASCVISIISTSSGTEDYKVIGNMFDAKLKDRILKLRKGDRFYINEVHGIGPDNRAVDLNSLMIKVK